MQRTPTNRSDMARFSRNTFVMVRIRLFCTSVRITNEFPITARKKIIAYNGICTFPVASQLAMLGEGAVKFPVPTDDEDPFIINGYPGVVVVLAWEVRVGNAPVSIVMAR